MIMIVEMESYLKNPLLGPHGGRELKLMLQGTKPAALISKFETDKIQKFEVYVTAKTIKHVMEIDTINHNNIHIIYTLPGQEYRAEKIKEIYDDVIQTNNMTNEHHIALGKLLGYSDREINEFVRRG